MTGFEVLFDNVRAGNIGGHQVGRELDATELKPKRVGDRAHHQCLRGARHARQKAVAADKDRNQNLVEHLLLSHDDLSHLIQDLLAHCMEALDPLLE